MTDPFAIIPPDVVQETKTISTTVVSYGDWGTLTNKDDNTNSGITGVRVQCNGKVNYTIDGTDPTVSVGFYQMPDWEKDYTWDIWSKMKLIRNGATNASVTVIPISFSK